MWAVVEGRCPWCGSDRETVYQNFHSKDRICANCILKLYKAAMKDVWLPLIESIDTKRVRIDQNE